MSDNFIPCQAEGANPNDWFAPPGSHLNRAMKELCFQHCSVYFHCAEAAITEGIPYGIFGGLDERDRARIWKKQGGRPSTFTDAMEAQVRPLQQARRDHENFNKQHKAKEAS